MQSLSGQTSTTPWGCHAMLTRRPSSPPTGADLLLLLKLWAAKSVAVPQPSPPNSSSLGRCCTYLL